MYFTYSSVYLWRRKWQPTPVFLPGESQGQKSLVGCHLWGHTESDITEVTQQQQQCISVNLKLLIYASPFPSGNCKFVCYLWVYFCFYK